MATSEFISVSGSVIIFPSQITEVYFRYLGSVIAEINESLKENNKNYSVIDNLSANNFSSEYFLNFRLLRDSKSNANAVFDYSFKLSFINNTLYFVTILGAVKIGQFDSLEILQNDIASKLSKYGFSLSGSKENHYNFDPQFLYNGLPIIEEKQETISPANARKITGIISLLLKKENAEFRGSIKDVKSFTRPMDLTKWFEISQNLLPIPKNVLNEDLSSNSQENGVEDSRKGSSDSKQIKSDTPVVNFVFTNNGEKVSCYPNPNDTNVQICNIDSSSKSESKKEASFYNLPNILIAVGTLGIVTFSALKFYNHFTRNRINHQKQDEFMANMKQLTAKFIKVLSALQGTPQKGSSQGDSRQNVESFDYDAGGSGDYSFSPQPYPSNGRIESVNSVIDLLKNLKTHPSYKDTGKTFEHILRAFGDIQWVGDTGERLQYPGAIKKIFTDHYKTSGMFNKKTLIDFSDMLGFEGFIEKFREIFEQAKEGGVREQFLKRLAVHDAGFNHYLKQYDAAAEHQYVVRPETYEYLRNLLDNNAFNQYRHVNSFITVVALKALAAITGTEATNDEEIKAPNNLVQVLRNKAEITAIEECYRSDFDMSDEEQDDCYSTMLDAFEQNAKNLVTFHFNDPRNIAVREVVVDLTQHNCIEIISSGELKVLEIKTDDLGGRYLEDISILPDLEFNFCQKVMI